MKPLQFIVVGSGWRSLFYARIAEALPEQFRMLAMVCRTEEKAERMRREYRVPAVTAESPQEYERLESKTPAQKHQKTASASDVSHAAGPDFVVAAVNKASIFQVTRQWALAGYPVLCETPAGMTLAELRKLWSLVKDHGARVAVAEQYFRYPSIAAGIGLVRSGILGDPYMMTISAVHDYHAASLIRQFLGIGMENMTVYGKSYRYPVEETSSREGAVTDGRVSERDRVRLTFEFEGGKTAFYDFCGIQYHSFIRTRHLNVQGERGELDDWTLRYVDENHVPHEREIVAREPGAAAPVGSGCTGAASAPVGSECAGAAIASAAYEPAAAPAPCVSLSEDETAIASLMLGMRGLIEDGTEPYPLAEALQDAYVRILMEEALKDPGREVHSETQVWSK